MTCMCRLPLGPPTSDKLLQSAIEPEVPEVPEVLEVPLAALTPDKAETARTDSNFIVAKLGCRIYKSIYSEAK